MSTTLTTSAKLALNITYASTATDSASIQDIISQISTLSDLTSGTGASKANTLYHGRVTLASSASQSFNLYALTDAFGNSIVNARIRLLYLYNRNSTTGDILTLFNDGTTAAWSGPLGGVDSATVPLYPGGFFVLAASDATGYAVANTTNHLFKVTNSSSNSIDFDIIIVGVTA